LINLERSGMEGTNAVTQERPQRFIRPNKLGDQFTLQLGSKRCIMDLEILLIRKFLRGEIYGIGELF